MESLFPNNTGTFDRLARFIVGAALLSLVFVGPKTPLGLIGVLPLLTAAVGSCPAYRLFGLSTCSTSKDE